MKSVAAAVVFMWLASCCAGALAEAVQGHVFNVRDHGATGDGKSLDTAAIQKALDACGEAGGGTVLLPPGTYLSRPLDTSHQDQAAHRKRGDAARDRRPGRLQA